VSVGFHWETESTSETEIGEFDVSIFVNKQVLWFKISVHYSVRMAVCSSLQNLIGEAFYFMRWEWAAYLSHVLLQVVLAVLKY
jgi:hypothetical protein